MITDAEKWHYFALTRLPALLKGITSKHVGDFYCLNCFRACTTENRLKRHKNVCENHDYCCIEMPNEDNKILKYNYREKSMKAQFIIYADLESLLEKSSTCYDSPKKSSIIIFISHDRGENCMKRFCQDLREHITKIINDEKKEMIPLTKKSRKQT